MARYLSVAFLWRKISFNLLLKQDGLLDLSAGEWSEVKIIVIPKGSHSQRSKLHSQFYESHSDGSFCCSRFEWYSKIKSGTMPSWQLMARPANPQFILHDKASICLRSSGGVLNPKMVQPCLSTSHSLCVHFAILSKCIHCYWESFSNGSSCWSWFGWSS